MPMNKCYRCGTEFDKDSKEKVDCRGTKVGGSKHALVNERFVKLEDSKIGVKRAKERVLTAWLCLVPVLFFALALFPFGFILIAIWGWQLHIQNADVALQTRRMGEFMAELRQLVPVEAA